MESKKLGPAGILAIGKQPDPSQGSLKCLDLMLLNSWYVSRSLFGSWLLLLKFTQFTEVCWANAQLPLNQLKKWPLLYPSKSLLCSVCLPCDLFLYSRWLPFSFHLSFWDELAESVCLTFLFFVCTRTWYNTVSYVYMVSEVLNIYYLPFFFWSCFSSNIDIFPAFCV